MHHEIFPVFDGERLIGTCSLWKLSQVKPDKWDTTRILEITDPHLHEVSPETDVTEALRLLLSNHTQPMLLVVKEQEKILGVVTKTDILQALRLRRPIPDTPEEVAEAYIGAV